MGVNEQLEILDLQLKTFEKYFDLAIVHHLPWMIVIHGVAYRQSCAMKFMTCLSCVKEVKKLCRTDYHPANSSGATEIYFGY